MALSTPDRLFAFNLLPVEILHSIFDYLWAHDIFYSFHNISSYLRSAISNYNNYHVNFQSILKRHFDRVCHHIRPDQITSLVLSDSDDTPGQSHTLLSLFPIDQFTRLQALKLAEIDNDSQPLFAGLNQVASLLSFEIDTMSHLRFIESVPQLKRLVVNKYCEDYYEHESFLSSMTFSHICSLTLPYCSYNQLRQILSRALNLTSLTISLSISDCSGIDYFAEQRQDVPLALTHLNLSIHTFTRTISRLLLERFLARMPRLRELELVVSSGGSPNLFDGDQWEIFILDHLPSLTTFDFKFKIINIDHNKHDKESILAPFYTPFWMDNNRHWYVAFNTDDLVLYTVPRFSPRTITYPFHAVLSHATTSPVEQYATLYHSVTELELGSDCKPPCRYTHVRKLTLLISNIDENVIDVSQVEYLCIKTTAWSLTKLVQLIRKSMPRLYHLKIDCSISWIKNRNIVPLEQIRILDLPQFFPSPKNDEIDLSLLFPCVERLKIEVNTCYQMVLLIDRLKNLSNGSFHIINFQTDIADRLREPEGIRQWLIETLPRLATNDNFTFRLDSQSWLHLWMVDDNKPADKLSNTSSTDTQSKTMNEDSRRRGHSRHCLLQ